VESQERCEVPGAASESETTSGSEELANNGERMRWLAERERERESLVRRPECRTIRADPLGDVADAGGAVLLALPLFCVPRVCFSRAFCSPIPDRSRASAAACYVRATVCGNRQDMVRGSVYTASSVVRHVIIVYHERQAL
jgi:hypothetical protein